MPKRKTNAEKLQYRLEEALKLAEEICEFNCGDDCPLSGPNEKCERMEIRDSLSVVNAYLKRKVTSDNMLRMRIGEGERNP